MLCRKSDRIKDMNFSPSSSSKKEDWKEKGVFIGVLVDVLTEYDGKIVFNEQFVKYFSQIKGQKNEKIYY